MRGTSPALTDESVCVCMGIPLMKKAVSVQFESGAVRPAFHPLQTFNSCSKLETLL